MSGYLIGTNFFRVARSLETNCNDYFSMSFFFFFFKCISWIISYTCLGGILTSEISILFTGWRDQGFTQRFLKMPEELAVFAASWKTPFSA